MTSFIPPKLPLRQRGNFLDENGQVELEWFRWLSAINNNVAFSLDVVVTTGTRPNPASKGQRVYDESLSIPIWFDGTDWKDAAGNIV